MANSNSSYSTDSKTSYSCKSLAQQRKYTSSQNSYSACKVPSQYNLSGSYDEGALPNTRAFYIENSASRFMPEATQSPLYRPKVCPRCNRFVCVCSGK